jgi:hypothetical protein
MLFPIDLSSIVVVSLQDLLSLDRYIFFFLTHNPFWLSPSTFYHDSEKKKEKVPFLFSSSLSPHAHILETYIEPCLLYTYARAPKLHNQSRDR